MPHHSVWCATRAEPLFAFTFQWLHYLQHTGPVNLDYSADPSMLFQVQLHMERDVALVHWAAPRNCSVEGLYSPLDLRSKHVRHKSGVTVITASNLAVWCSVVKYVTSLQKEAGNLEAHVINWNCWLSKINAKLHAILGSICICKCYLKCKVMYHVR